MKRFAFAAFVVTLWFCFAASTWASPQAEELFRKGYMASMARKWVEAVELYTRAIEAAPDRAEIYFQRAVALEMEGKLDAAIADYHKSIKLNPSNYISWEYLAKLYERKGDYASAVELYKRALPLVTTSKWRSIVKWWIEDAKKKMKQSGKESRRVGRETRLSAGWLF